MTDTNSGGHDWPRDENRTLLGTPNNPLSVSSDGTTDQVAATLVVLKEIRDSMKTLTDVLMDIAERI